MVSRAAYADCEAFKLAGASPSNSGTTRTLLAPFDRIRPLPAAAGPLVVGPRAWRNGALQRIRASRSFGSLAAAARARLDLLPFQLEPTLAMLRHGHLRLLIADDVGLGKTVQAGLILNELSDARDGFRALVLCPAGLREQWRGELESRFALASIDADTAWLAASARELPPDVNPWTLPGLYVASLDLVKRPEVLRALEDVTWDITVIDEAHGCGAGTARRAAAHALALRSRRVVLLTATPPDGDPAQLGAMASIGALDGDRLLEFRRSRADVWCDAPGAAPFPRRRSILLQVRLSAAERRMHRLLERYTSAVWQEAAARRDSHARLAATVLRKRALSGPWSLAASVRRRLALLTADGPLTASQLPLPFADEDPLDDDVPDAVMGAAGMADAAREQALLAAVQDAAERASLDESKVRLLRRFLKRVGEPVIVFTEYRDTLVHLESVLRAGGHVPVLLHGGMLPRERADAQREFNARGSLLLATDAASEGLNLHTRCRVVVHFELPWTPARMQQRTGRVDRLGQARAVHEISLVARHTAERLVLAPLVRRAHIASRKGNGRRAPVAALTESRVAAAIMAGMQLETVAAGDDAANLCIQFRDEARGEAVRIGRQRSVQTAANRHPPLDRVLVCGFTRTSDAAVTLLFDVALEDAAGRIVHSTTVSLVAEMQFVKPPRRGTELRRLASELRAAPFIAAAVSAAADDLAAARRWHAAVSDALRRRGEAMRRSLTSAARTLVQIGLFDSRGARMLERRRRATGLRLDDVDERAAWRGSSRELDQRIRLVAVRLRGVPR